MIPRHELPRTMGLLSDADILQYVAKGEIGIEPFDAENLTPNGYDVSVDEVVVPATEGKPDPNRIPPRTRFAVSTRETIQLGRHVAGQIWLRTTWARRGVIASFGIIDAGFSGTLTFGAFNASSEPLELPIEDHAVDGSDSLQDGTRVSFEDRDPFRSIRGDVRSEESNGDRIRVRGDDLPRPATFRDEDRVRADPREGVGDPLALAHQVRDSFPFRREARTEVGLREVDTVAESMFPVDRGRSPLSGDRVEFSDSVHAFDAPILEDHLEAGIPPEDCGPDRKSTRLNSSH